MMLDNVGKDYAQKMQRCNEYVEALEVEQKKIQVFQRELPLCLELVTKAIETCRRELSGSSTSEHAQGQSDCSEQTTSVCAGPVFEEFIPMKRSSLCEEEGEHESHKPEKIEKISGKKSDWLRSVQLWNPSPDSQPKEDRVAKKTKVVEVKPNTGAFQPFQKENRAPEINLQLLKATCSAPTTSSTTETGGAKSDTDKAEGEQRGHQSLSRRKQRRCWSPELHRRFLHALQQLGGSHVATPKQIREHMKVDGLTNDEVKSHLQKYRLHTRRPATSGAAHGSRSPQQPQFVVVGGIWVPSPPAEAAKNSVYAPVAALPSTRSSESPKQSAERSSGRCNSPAASSSTNTTIISSHVL